MDRNLGLLAPVFRWFRDQLIILEPGAPYVSLELEGSNRRDLRDHTIDLLSRSGTGVTGVELREQPLASSRMGAEMTEELSTLRADRDIRKAYLEGRFSGIPHLAPLRARGRRASIAAVDGETQPPGDPVAVSAKTRGGT